MSEKLLLQFMDACDEEDLNRKSKRVKRYDRTRKMKQEVSGLLAAASKNLVELPPEEAYLVEPKKKRKAVIPAGTVELDMAKASKGLSLVEQARNLKPKDLANRNVRCIKYMEKRKFGKLKENKLIEAHLRDKTDKRTVRTQRQAITCVREPRSKKATGGSVFNEKDFGRASNKVKTLRPM